MQERDTPVRTPEVALVAPEPMIVGPGALRMIAQGYNDCAVRSARSFSSILAPPTCAFQGITASRNVQKKIGRGVHCAECQHSTIAFDCRTRYLAMENCLARTLRCLPMRKRNSAP